MQYNRFGKLGFDVSRFGIGCMRLPLNGDGSNLKDINEEEAIKMIRYAIDNGVNYVDTAYPYHGKMSEPLVAKALKDGYRERVKLATKLPVWLTKTYEDFDKYLDEQLGKLETDHIDFYLLHSLDREDWRRIKELNVLGFLDKAKKSGKIRHAGFSFHDELSAFKEIIDSYDWDMCQIQLNIIDENNQAGVEGLRYAGKKGIPVVIMEPLKGGKLGRNIPDEVKNIYDSSGIKRSPVDWAFKWLYNFPEVAVILSGVSTMEQLKDNIRIFEHAPANSMTPEELSVISKVKEYYLSRTKVGCTRCSYCMPCPAGVSIPDIFELYNNMYIYGTEEESRGAYKRLSENNKGVAKCVECRKCENICPQGLKVPERLKEAHAVLSRQ